MSCSSRCQTNRENEAVWDILNEICAYDINAQFIFVFDERKRMNNKRKRIIKIIIPLIIAILSVFVFARFTTSTEYHAKTIQSLDEKKTTVMELTAASTAASAAITLIPGDTGTPIAEKLADLSSYFLIVLCALFLEKYLLTITGYAAFMILIPIACVLYSASEIFKRNIWKQLAYKLVLFGLGIYLIVPVSVKVSDMIETTYQTSIEQTIDSAKQTTEEIKDSSDEEESSGVSGFISKVKDGVSTTTSKIENILNDFIEALAVMIVTSCLIPILVMIFFVWIIKGMLGMDMTGWKRIERI